MYAGSKESSPLRTSYGQYSKEVGLSGTPVNAATKTMDMGSSSYLGLDRELSDLNAKEASLVARIDTLEKENKSLQLMVRKTEKMISDAYKKAQEEENKIFNLFIGVIKEKDIKIDMNDINSNFMNRSSGGLQSSDLLDDKPKGQKLENGELSNEELANLLLEQLGLTVGEQANDLPMTLLALQRKTVLSSNS